MHLTRMALNGARRGAWKLLQSPQAMHAAVLSGFPPQAPTATDAGRVLWRIDRAPNTIWLYIVSPEPPDLAHLVEQAGWPTQSTWETREYSPFLSRLRNGQTWAFRLTANPVHTVTETDGTSKRRGHVTVAQQESWLLDRAEQHGFRVLEGAGGADLAVSRREHKKFRRGGSEVTLATAQFDGALEVLDANALRTALSAGIGRAKGYGCGLMTLAPLPTV
jgi:CRISPR system Cascade subunit CasE